MSVSYIPKLLLNLYNYDIFLQSVFKGCVANSSLLLLDSTMFFFGWMWFTGTCRRAGSGQSTLFLLWMYHLHVVTSPNAAPLN